MEFFDFFTRQYKTPFFLGHPVYLEDLTLSTNQNQKLILEMFKMYAFYSSKFLNIFWHISLKQKIS